VRILIASSYYPAFVEAHYAERPGLADASYAEQLSSLQSRGFGTAEVYCSALAERGHETAELVLNCDALQAAWAREQGRPARALRAAARLPTRAGALARSAWLHRTAAAQVRAFKPDVLYLKDLWFFRPRELERLRSGGPLVAGQIASRAPGEEVLRTFDLLVSSFPHYVERFRALGVESRYLRIAFDERIPGRLRDAGADPSPDSPRSRDVVFIGGVHPDIHPARVELLERVAEVAGLDLWGYGAEELPAASPIRARSHGPVWGLDMYQILAGSKIVINAHIDVAEGRANNMRMFEATGCGALLVTEEAPNLGDMFEPGREVVTYSGPDELVTRVREMLGDDAARNRIAAGGQGRTMREHTYARRAAELEAILEEALSQRV
jgi:spore maturation protein CgeB